MATRPWLPTDLGADLVAWWDASDLAALASGAAVNSWKAKGGGLPVATAGGTAPTFNPTARNGKPGVLWANVASYFTWNGALLDGAADVTVAISAYMNGGASNGSNRPLFSAGTATGTGPNNQTIEPSKGTAGFASEPNIGPTATGWKDQDHFMVATKTGASGTLVVDGSDTVTNANAFGGPIVANEGSIGRSTATRAWSYWWGFIQQIVVVKRAISTADRQRLEGWDSWYTGKNGANLPANHPYKAAAPTVSTGNNYDLLGSRGAKILAGTSGLRVRVPLHTPKGADGFRGTARERVSVALHAIRGGFVPAGRVLLSKDAAAFAVAGRIEQGGALGAFGVQPVLRTAKGAFCPSGAISGQFRAVVVVHPLAAAMGLGGTARLVTSAAVPLMGLRGALGLRATVGPRLTYGILAARGAYGARGTAVIHYTLRYAARGALAMGGSLGFGYGWSDLTYPGREPDDLWLDTATPEGPWQDVPGPQQV